jgi:hypothetical protein
MLARDQEPFFGRQDLVDGSLGSGNGRNPQPGLAPSRPHRVSFTVHFQVPGSTP